MKISEVLLFTNNIQKQKQVYKHVLNFEQVLDTPQKISFKAGVSLLSFEYRSNTKPSHLAFNIPSNAINDAHIWLKKCTEILKIDNEAIFDFIDWKAKSIYFYDADKNIMEFIARERIDIESDTAFSPRSILSISEMAMATTDVESVYIQLNSLKPIPIFSGDFNRFCAVGNDEGLFIIINKNKKTWFPTSDEVFTSDFIIKGDFNFSFENGKIKEIV